MSSPFYYMHPRGGGHSNGFFPAFLLERLNVRTYVHLLKLSFYPIMHHILVLLLGVAKIVFFLFYSYVRTYVGQVGGLDGGRKIAQFVR